jgi:hypothetical protein
VKELLNRKITLGIWSIKVFHSHSFISMPPNEKSLEHPTLQASDVTDVSAEFIADPFIMFHDSKYHMFFEVLDKSSRKGIIGLATSTDGEQWNYEKIVLKECFHLSYPYVFEFNGDYYMIPESSESNRVLLYKAKNFPYNWEIAYELLSGRYVDSSIFQYKDKWWIFTGKSGKLHLFFSDKLEGNWKEHPKSPLISNDYHTTRPGGRVLVDRDDIYRYTQDGKPSYGSAVRVFKVKKLTETDYQEEEVNLVLSGTKRELDWRKDGMHNIDQLKTTDGRWLIAVDGHKLKQKNHIIWKLGCGIDKFVWWCKSFG